MAAARDSTEILLDELEDSGYTRRTSTPIPIPTHEETLGRYQLRFVLAEGGMATIYLAVARGPAGFGRVFAVKKIHSHLAMEPDFIDMFFDEARIASLIQHPNVVSVLDYGEAEGGHFLAMDYVMGETLRALARALPRRAPPRFWYRIPEIAARIVASACEGVHAAHETTDVDGYPLGVVHRDISPHNLLVSYDGTVKVVDFGIAKAENRAHQTAVGMVKGKFAYMAPEQLRGHEVDRRADVWSLGVVLWELIAGRPLFLRPMESDTIIAVDRMEIPSLARYRDDIPADLDAIVQKALRRDRDARYPTARALGVALSRWATAARAPIEAADLSDLMRELFPERLEQQRKLVQSALRWPVETGTRDERDTRDTLDAREVLERGQELSASAVVRVRPRSTVISQRTPRGRRRKEASLARRATLTFLLAVGLTVAAALVGAIAGLVQPLRTADAPHTSNTSNTIETATPLSTGELIVVSPHGAASVWVGQTNMGPTPARVTLPVGQHLIVLRPVDGARTLSFLVDVIAGQQKTIRVDIDPR